MVGAKEECGIAAVALKKDLSHYSCRGGVVGILETVLYQLQHRGQESTGIATYNEEHHIKLKRYAEVGKVDEVLRVNDRSAHKKILDYYTGTKGIGHVRYSTSGVGLEYGDLLAEAQPFLRQHGRRWKKFAIAFNGNLANYKELVQELKEHHEYDLDTSVDTEVIMHFLSIDMRCLEEIQGKEASLEEVLKANCKRYDGAYNVVFLNGKGDLLVFRDPWGLRPMVYGENDELFVVASESNALKAVGINESLIKEVQPGGGIIVKNGKSEEFGHTDSVSIAECAFEKVYFMWDSSMCRRNDGEIISINTGRRNLGVELGKIEPLKEKIEDEREKYIVVPVPDTSIPAAEGLASYLKIPCLQAIRKKKYGIASGRGFINKPEMRRLIMENKYDLITELVKGMRVILVDDSVVRGDTSGILVNLLKEVVEEIHLRSTFPPIRFPCYYGIDFPTLGELIAAPYESIGEAERKIREVNGLDSMGYQRIDGLLRAIGGGGNCLACITGDYPTKYGKVRYEEARIQSVTPKQ